MKNKEYSSLTPAERRLYVRDKNKDKIARKLGLGIDNLSSRCHGALGANLAAFDAVDNVTSNLNIVILRACKQIFRTQENKE